jgi:hypothetical protein
MERILLEMNHYFQPVQGAMGNAAQCAEWVEIRSTPFDAKLQPVALRIDAIAFP